jgi:hypothetical protein
MTNGKPTRVAMRQSMTNKVCNNFSMKLPGLIPTATAYTFTSDMLRNNGLTKGVDYPFNHSCNPYNWKRYNGSLLWSNKYVGPQSKVNGVYKIN